MKKTQYHKLLRLLLVLLLACTPFISFATFTLSGTTVTQTGTDTVTAITTIAGATSSLENNITVFNFAGNNLIINGTLNLPEGIAFHGIGQLTGTGVLNIGTEKLNQADYNYNNGIVNFWGNAANTLCDVTISIYGGSFINEASLYTNKPVTIRNSRWNIQGRFDPIGGGVMTDSVFNMYNTTVYWFVRASFSEWDNNIVTAPSYFSLSILTAVGNFIFKNINLRTGQDLIHYGSDAINRVLNIYNLSVGTNYLTNNQTLAGDRNFTLNLYQEFIDNISDTAGVGIQGAKVYIKGNATSYQEGVTDNLGNTSIDFLYHKNIKTSGVEARTEYHNGSDELEKHIFSYNHFSPPPKIFTVKNASAYNEAITLLVDQNITETTKAAVDAYTSIDNLDQLYDRAKSWKIDHVNMEVPTINSLLITGDESQLDLDDYNLTIDATATPVFAVNTGTNTITIRGNTLVGGAKFTSIETTGTVSTLNGGTLEFGYIDSTGTNKYVQLNGLTNYDVEVIDNSDPNNQTIISSSSNFTGDYKDHFLLGTATEVLVRLKTESGHIFYSEVYPQDDLSFIRSNFPISASEENQEKALFLALKILQKEETIHQTLEGTTATVTIANTIVNSDAEATDENQIAIIQLLERILSKITANRNSFD